MDNKKSCNSNIQCTVNSCAYHNPQNYCSLIRKASKRPAPDI